MLASGNEFIKEFAERTKHVYEDAKKGDYEVTALINCMVGLLIVPKERLFDKIDNAILGNEKVAELKKCVKANSYHQTLDLKFICRHLRNAVAHSNFEFKAEKPVIIGNPLIINSVVFEDHDDFGHSCDIEMNTDQLENFLYAFTDSILKVI